MGSRTPGSPLPRNCCTWKDNRRMESRAPGSFPNLSHLIGVDGDSGDGGVNEQATALLDGLLGGPLRLRVAAGAGIRLPGEGDKQAGGVSPAQGSPALPQLSALPFRLYRLLHGCMRRCLLVSISRFSPPPESRLAATSSPVSKVQKQEGC